MENHFRRRYYLIFFSSILGPLTTNSLVPIFEELRMNFNLVSIALVSLAISFYILPFAIFQLFAGTFSDIIDKKKVVMIGYVIFVTGLILTYLAVLAKIFLLFLIGFFIQGIGFSFINPTILAILSIISPEEKKGLVMGIYNSSAGFGVSLGALLSGFLARYFSRGWELLFILNPIITILSLCLFILALKNCEALVCRTFDFQINKSIQAKESKMIQTLHQLKTNLKKEITLLGILGFLCFFIVITLTNTLNEQMRFSLKHLDSQEIILYVSIILTINGLISITLSPITGYLLKTKHPLKMLIIGFALTFSMVFMPFSTSIYHFMLISFITYLGSVFIWPALFKIAMDITPEAKGTNSAIINSFRFIGYASVGPFYVLFGIPIIYIWVISFNFCAIFIILILFKIVK
ncbi:MAG: MFS transporter [Promethearchaeota archaeon]|nr:MAG: MFS transporter [Candidatus Lokiarchaeota archaeon]